MRYLSSATRISSPPIQRYGQVVAALTRTCELMQEIDQVVNDRLWPKAAERAA